MEGGTDGFNKEEVENSLLGECENGWKGNVVGLLSSTKDLPEFRQANLVMYFFLASHNHSICNNIQYTAI